MSHRSFHAPLVAAILAVLAPATAQAGSTSPFTIGIGKFIPTSPSSSVEGFASQNIQQRGNISAEISFGRDLIPGGYQITALLLSQRQTGSFITPLGPLPANETITQIPLMFEGGGSQLGPVRFGGGLGYDFVSSSSFTGAPRTSGILGDTYVEFGLGSGAALEAKYFFGQRAALSGVYVGLKTRL